MLAITVLVTLGSSELLSASRDSSKDKIMQIPFSTIDKGVRSGIRERKFLLIRTEKEWENLWRLHKAPFVPEKRIPLIDFGQEMIVAVFSGEKKTGGYSIEITKIQEDRKSMELIVLFHETRPPSNAMVTQALTQPYHIAKMARTDSTVKFIPGN
jgi:PrcB C-terminal